MEPVGHVVEVGLIVGSIARVHTAPLMPKFVIPPILNLLPAGHTGVSVLAVVIPREPVVVGGVDVDGGGGGGGGGGVDVVVGGVLAGFGASGRHVYFLVTGFVVNPYPDGQASLRQLFEVTSYVPTVHPQATTGLLVHL